MAATGYTPISLYYSATASAAPTAGNLVAGELALNTNDGKLYYKDSSNAVQVIGTKGGVGSSSTTQVLYNSSGLVVGSANLTFNGTTLTAGGLSSPTLTNAGTLALSATSTNIITASTNGSERMRVDSSGNIDIGTTSNAVFDASGAARPLVVQKSDTSTTVGGSLAAIAIVNGDTTTSNTAQLNFAAITGASANQYSSAWISCIFGARTNTQYPTGQLVFATSTTLNSAPSEKLRIDNSGNLLIGTSTSPAGSKELVLGGDYIEGVVAIGTVTTSNTISLANGTLQTATLTASTACTFTMPTAVAGKSFTLLLKQAASTGNGTATFTSVKWGTTGAPTITATAGKMDILTFVSDGTNWYGNIAQGYTP